MGMSRTVLLRMVDERKAVEEDLSYTDRGLETLQRLLVEQVREVS